MVNNLKNSHLLHEPAGSMYTGRGALGQKLMSEVISSHVSEHLILLSFLYKATWYVAVKTVTRYARSRLLGLQTSYVILCKTDFTG
jgi:hypothetical protein